MSNNQLKSIKIYTNNGVPTSISFVPVEGKEEQRPYKDEYINVIKKAYPSIHMEYVENALVTTSNELKVISANPRKDKSKYVIAAAAIITTGALIVNGVMISKKSKQTSTKETISANQTEMTVVATVENVIQEQSKVLDPTNPGEIEDVAKKIIKEAEQEPGVHISFDQMVRLIKVLNGVEVPNADFMELDNLMYTLMSIDVLDATKLLTGNHIQGKRTPFSTMDMISSKQDREYMSAFLSRRENLLDAYYYNGDIKGAQKDFIDFVSNTLLNEQAVTINSGFININDVNPLIQYFSYHVALTAMPLIDENQVVVNKQGQSIKAKDVLSNLNDKSIGIATNVIEVLHETTKTR